jgi:hypothetical protein
MKCLSNIYTLANSIRAFESALFKTAHYFPFYGDLLGFVIKSISDEKCKASADPTAINENPDVEDKHVAKQRYLFKILVPLFLQHRTTTNSVAQLAETSTATSSAHTRFTLIKQAFSVKIKPLLASARDEASLFSLVLDIYDLATSYAAQFQRKKQTESGAEESAALEKRLVQRFAQLCKAVDKKDDAYFYWLFNHLLDCFFSTLNCAYLNKPAMFAVFLTESLVDSLRQICSVYAANLKKLYAVNLKMGQEATAAQTATATANGVSTTTKTPYSDLTQKNSLVKPLIFMHLIGKLADLVLKTSKSFYCLHPKSKNYNTGLMF